MDTAAWKDTRPGNGGRLGRVATPSEEEAVGVETYPYPLKLINSVMVNL